MLLSNLKFFAESRRETRFAIFLISNHWALFRVKVLTSHLLETIRNVVSVLEFSLAASAVDH